MVLKIVEYQTPLYTQMVDLRERVLRKPLGMVFNEEFLLQDKDDIHIAAIVDGRVVGTLLLKPVDKHTLKMRQVAVDTDLQRNGVGTRLVEFAEQTAADKGYKLIVLNARYYAVDFYKRLGYKVVSGQFIEIGMPHYKMEKHL